MNEVKNPDPEGFGIADFGLGIAELKVSVFPAAASLGLPTLRAGPQFQNSKPVFCFGH